MLIGLCGVARASAGRTTRQCGVLADDSVGLYGLAMGSDARAAELSERLGERALKSELDLEALERESARIKKREFTLALLTNTRVEVVHRGDLELWRVRDGRLLRIAQPQSLDGNFHIDARSVEIQADDHLLFCTPEVLARGARKRSPMLGDLLDGVLGRGPRAAAADLLELALARDVKGCLVCMVVEVSDPS